MPIPTPNPNLLREIHREIASVVIISSDSKILMGRTHAGGVYPDVWHIPGGGVDPGETLAEAAKREALEEVGLHLPVDALKQLPQVGHGATEKTLKSGERVWAIMTFNRFECRLPQTSDELSTKMQAGDDMTNLHWFTREELETAEQIPGGREFFKEAGYFS